MGLLGSCQGSLPFSVKLWHQRRTKVSFRGHTREQKFKSLTTQELFWTHVCSSQEPGGLRPVGKGPGCRTPTSWAVSAHLPSEGLAASKLIEARTADGRSLLPWEGRGQGSPGRTWIRFRILVLATMISAFHATPKGVPEGGTLCRANQVTLRSAESHRAQIL